LHEIRDLAHLSQIDDAVVFRLNGILVEANGIVSTNKIDAWVGFLQAYSRRLGDLIGLRSYVQLQQETPTAAAPVPKMPLETGGRPEGKGADTDLARLKSGDFDAKETFAGPGRTQRGGAPAQAAPAPAKPPPPPSPKPMNAAGFILGPIAN